MNKFAAALTLMTMISIQASSQASASEPTQLPESASTVIWSVNQQNELFDGRLTCERKQSLETGSQQTQCMLINDDAMPVVVPDTHAFQLMNVMAPFGRRSDSVNPDTGETYSVLTVGGIVCPTSTCLVYR